MSILDMILRCVPDAGLWRVASSTQGEQRNVEVPHPLDYSRLSPDAQAAFLNEPVASQDVRPALQRQSSEWQAHRVKMLDMCHTVLTEAGRELGRTWSTTADGLKRVTTACKMGLTMLR